MEAADNLVLEQLRLIHAEIASIKQDGREVKNRLTTLEVGQGTVLQYLAHLASSITQQQISLDRVGYRVERIEHRLDLADAG